jgi:hypothetical protein
LNVLENLGFKQSVNIAFTDYGIFNIENFNRFFQRLILVHHAEHFNKTVLFVIFKKKVKVDSKSAYVPIVAQDFQEETFSVSLEKRERILDDFDLLSSFKKLNSAQVNLMELHSLWSICPFTQEKCLLVNSAHGLNNFFLCEKLEDANTWPNT